MEWMADMAINQAIFHRHFNAFSLNVQSYASPPVARRHLLHSPYPSGDRGFGRTEWY